MSENRYKKKEKEKDICRKETEPPSILKKYIIVAPQEGRKELTGAGKGTTEG